MNDIVSLASLVSSIFHEDARSENVGEESVESNECCILLSAESLYAQKRTRVDPEDYKQLRRDAEAMRFNCVIWIGNEISQFKMTRDIGNAGILE